MRDSFVMTYANERSVFNSFTIGALFIAASLYISPSFRKYSSNFGLASIEVVSIICNATWVRLRLLQHWIDEHPYVSFAAMWMTASLVQSSEIRQACTITAEILADACIIVVKDAWAFCKNANHMVNNFFCRKRPPGSGFFY